MQATIGLELRVVLVGGNYPGRILWHKKTRVPDPGDPISLAKLVVFEEHRLVTRDDSAYRTPHYHSWMKK